MYSLNDFHTRIFHLKDLHAELKELKISVIT